MDTAVGIVVGAILSWVITHYYYKLGNHEQHKQFDEFKDKLSSEVMDIILSTQKSNLTVLELNQILEEKIIDKELMDSDPLPYKCCAKCGSQDLEFTSREDYEHDEVYYIVKCNSCDWSEWTQ